MPMAARVDRLVTYLEGFLQIKYSLTLYQESVFALLKGRRDFWPTSEKRI